MNEKTITVQEIESVLCNGTPHGKTFRDDNGNLILQGDTNISHLAVWINSIIKQRYT